MVVSQTDFTLDQIKSQQIVIVAGMHRSGTSWVSSLLSELGIQFGDDLLSADLHNQRGYFEDRSFLSLNQRILNECVQQDKQSVADWGWSSNTSNAISGLERYIPEATKLIHTRFNINGVWGWKDPRNTILLDFWNELLPHAKYVFVYRFPWEVADSMQRLGPTEFLRHPNYAYEIWGVYNRKLLDFYNAHRDRCVLISTNELSRDPSRLVTLLESKLNLQLVFSQSQLNFERELFRSNFKIDAAKSMMANVFPQLGSLLLELETAADISSAILLNKNNSLRFNKSIPDTPDVSIIIPCYNQGIFLFDALLSIETFAPDESEVIILNDGSTDLITIEILNRLSLLGYAVHHQENVGLSTTRNRLVDLSRSDIVLPLDSDNRICENFIQKSLQILDQSADIGVVYGDRKDFGMVNEIITVWDFQMEKMVIDNYIDACAMIRKQVLKECGGYDVNLKAWEDWELWLHASKKGWRFYKLPFVTFEYRRSPGSMVSMLNDPSFKAICLKYIHQKHQELFISKEVNSSVPSNLNSQNQKAKSTIGKLIARLRIFQQKLHYLNRMFKK